MDYEINEALTIHYTALGAMPTMPTNAITRFFKLNENYIFCSSDLIYLKCIALILKNTYIIIKVKEFCLSKWIRSSWRGTNVRAK